MSFQYPCALCALFVASVVCAQDSSATLGQRVHNLFKTYCHRCHGEQGAVEGGVNYILDRDQLVKRKKLTPGNAAQSPLYQRVTAREMPPPEETARPSAAEVALLKQWIDAGAADFKAPTSRTFRSDSQVYDFIARDLGKFEATDQLFIRYFSLVPLYNAGRGDDELETYRQALSKLVNSLSWAAKIKRPTAIDAERTLYRIDVRDYKWSAVAWETLCKHYPYGVLRASEAEKRCIRATECDQPVLRADWFVASASIPPLYHELLNLPTREDELERQLRINVADNVKGAQAIRAGFNGSGVSRHNRLIERHETYFGAYWKSYDFSGSAGGQNLFAAPLGPSPLRNRFRHVGSEIIFNLPNGLQAYLLSDERGQRIDKGPLEVVSDPRRPDRAVINGLSCMSCHARGIIEKDDQIRPFLEKSAQSFSPEDRRQILSLYVPAEQMKKLMREDAQRFQKAVEASGCRSGGTEPVATLATRFETPLDLAHAAAELGMPATQLTESIAKSAELAKHLGALLVEGGVVQRDAFTHDFARLVLILELGKFLPPQVRVSTADGWRPPWATTRQPMPTPEIKAPSFELLREFDHVVVHETGVPAMFVNAAPRGIDCARNGELVASVISNNRIALWNPENGSILRTLATPELEKSTISALVFSPDGKQLAIAAKFPAKVRVLDVESGATLASFVTFNGFVNDVCFSHDGKRLAVASGNRTHLFDLQSRREGPFLPTVKKGVQRLLFTPDDRTLVLAGSQLVWIDIASGKLVATQDEHEKDVTALALSQDGTRLASGGADNVIRLWDVSDRKLLHTLKGHSAPVRDLAFSYDGKRLFSAALGASNGEAKVWQVATAKEDFSLQADFRGLTGIRPLAGGRHVLTLDSKLRVWDLGHAILIARHFGAHDRTINGVAFSGDSNRIATSGDDGMLRIWDAANLTILTSIKTKGQPGPLVWTTDMKHLWCPIGDSLQQFDTQSGEPTAAFPLEPSAHSSIALSKDDKLLALGSKLGVLQIFDLETKKQTQSKAGPKFPLQVAFSPDGTRLAMANANRIVNVWDPSRNIKEQVQVGVGLMQPAPASALAFTPDGKHLLVAATDRRMRLWDFRSGELVSTYESHPATIRALAFFADGKRLLTGSDTQGFTDVAKVKVDALVIWDAELGKKRGGISTLINEPVRMIAIAPNGRSAAIVFGNKFYRLTMPK